MTDNQFDNFVRAKLHDHSAPVPAGLWDKVNPAKDDDDRKGIIIPRKFRWGLPLLALLILAGSVTGYFIFRDDTVENTISKQDSVAQTGSASSTNEAITEQNISSKTLQQNTIPEKEQQNNSIDNKNTLTRKEATDNYTNASSINNRITDKSSVTEDKAKVNADFPASTHLTTNTASINEIENVSIRNSNRKNITPGSFESDRISNKKNINTPLPLLTASAKNVKNETAETASIENEGSIEYPVTLSGNFEPGNTLSLSKANFGLSGLMQREHANAAYAKKFRNIIVCPPYKVRNTDWFADVYVSPDIAFKSVENRSATAQYLAKKDSSESMRLGYSAGVRLVKPITDNFLIRTGVQYTQINEKFTYRTEDEVKTITVISVRTIIRGPGDTLRVTDTSTVQQVGYKTNSIKNRYRSFDIPVTVGYQFGNDNLKFGINAGVIFNISSWYQGVILDSSLSAVPISKGSNQVYRNNIGLGLYGGISVLKKIGDNTQLFFEPYFRYNLSGITSGQASYQQKFSLGGLSIGLRYNLNRQ